MQTLKKCFSGWILGGLLIWGLMCSLPAVEASSRVVILPYVQDGSDHFDPETDSKMICWVSEGGDDSYTVQYQFGDSLLQEASIESGTLDLKGKTYHFYHAQMKGLPLSSQVKYTVKKGEEVLRNESFPTRKKKSDKITFIVVGDKGKSGSRPVKMAWRIAQSPMDFGIIVGDIVYESGLFSEYLDHYVDYYINAREEGEKTGTSLLGRVPFYFAIGNHDVRGHDLLKSPDGLAAFYVWHPPYFSSPPFSYPLLQGTEDQKEAFRKVAGPSFPALANYSFENGDAHFLVLDANGYVNVANKEWREWIRKDLTTTTSNWKFVCFHQPPFHSSKTHFGEQQMRMFAPLFEECGVDVVFSGHVHNYERSKPLKFKPSLDLDKAATLLASGVKTGITGTFSLDDEYDGVKNIHPKGVIYIVTGSGGAQFYDPDYTDKPEKWKNDAPYTVKFIADRSSYSKVTVEGNHFQFRQIDEDGREIDAFQIEK